MKMLSATDVAIAAAIVSGTLSVSSHPSTLGGTYIAIEDQHGLIEVAQTAEQAEERIAAIRAAIQHQRRGATAQRAEGQCK